MPNLQELLAKAKEKEISRPSKKLTRGIRPDMVIEKPISFEEPGQNVAIETRTQPERSRKAVQNEVTTQPERSQQPGQNVAIERASSNGDPTLLVGTQRLMFKYFFELTQNFASLTTPRLTLETMSAATGLRETQVHSATKQLRQKGCILLSDRKDGRGGWVEYSVSQVAFDFWIRLENKHNRSQNEVTTQPKRSQQPGHKAVHKAPSSSRDLLIKEESTTTRADSISRIDLSSVQPLGVTASVLSRCIELYPSLQPEQLEVLVSRFAEFAKDPKARVQNARGFFISLAEQASKGQVPLDHIESPDDRLMRLYVERQKEALNRRQEVERAALEFECEAWLESLTQEAKLTLVPETSILKAGTGAYAAMLKQHFIENVWPERRMKILELEANP